MFKLNAKFDADSLLYSFSHFECHGHTVHMLTQRHWLHPLTSTVKSSLFIYAHSSPLSLPARLHQCCTNYSRYINNGWTFSRQTSYTCGSLLLAGSRESLAGCKEISCYDVNCTWRKANGWETWMASRSWGLQSYDCNELNSTQSQEFGRGPWIPNKNAAWSVFWLQLSKILSEAMPFLLICGNSEIITILF